MSASRYHFELLHYVWLEGFLNNLLDESERPVVFNSVEEALEDFQRDFDTWAEEIRRGERDREEAFDPEEFSVRCVETDACCEFKLVGGKLVLIAKDGRKLKSKSVLEKINRTGLFQ